jgi:predicted cupin superfamily sugar epimerase
MHRLPIDEVWHFYQGSALELLLLHPDGAGEVRQLGGGSGSGGDGQLVQTVVPAGTWMGARVAPGGTWTLFGTTMAPGFLPADYEGGDADDLSRRHPAHEPLIRALCRRDGPTRMPGDVDRPGSGSASGTRNHPGEAAP